MIIVTKKQTTAETVIPAKLPYINKLGKKADRYQIEMQEISSMMSPEVFSSTARLSSLYLLGYDHEMKYLFTKKEKLSNDETAKNGNEEE